MRDYDKSMRYGTEMRGKRFFSAFVKSDKDIAALVHYNWIRGHDILPNDQN
jgi:hypothetical protein